MRARTILLALGLAAAGCLLHRALRPQRSARIRRTGYMRHGPAEAARTRRRYEARSKLRRV